MFEEEAVGLGQSRPGGLAMRSGCCWQRTLALGRGQDSGIPRRDGGLGRGPCRAGRTGSRLGHAGCLFEGIARGRGGSRAGKERRWRERTGRRSACPLEVEPTALPADRV